MKLLYIPNLFLPMRRRDLDPNKETMLALQSSHSLWYPYLPPPVHVYGNIMYSKYNTTIHLIWHILADSW